LNAYREIETGLSAVSDYYRALDAQKEASLRKLATSSGPVARELTALKIQHDAHLKAIKGRFNLFTVLLGIGDETRLHSRWLAHLLDPNSSHDCGPLFLKLFLATLRKGVQPHSDDVGLNQLDQLEGFDVDKAEVRRELPIGDGRIDIQIESPNWGAIVIENKIWAGEQLGQIQRYAEYLKNRRGVLLYLTPDGKPSDTAGSSADYYYRISYRDQILQWLEECMRATYQHININQALQQYRNVVSQLTGTSSDNEYMQKVIEILKEHPAIIEHLDDINAAVSKLREDYWGQFTAELQRQLTERGIELGAPNHETKNYPQLYFATKYNAWATPKDEFGFMVEWGEKEASLYFGACLHHYGNDAKISQVGARGFEPQTTIRGFFGSMG
jgi:hypothetical protein